MPDGIDVESINGAVHLRIIEADQEVRVVFTPELAIRIGSDLIQAGRAAAISPN